MESESPDPPAADRKARELAKGIAAIATPTEAAAVLDKLETVAGDRKEEDAAHDVPALSEKDPAPVAAIAEVAGKAAAASPTEKGTLDGAISQATGGPDEAVADPDIRQARKLLRQELIRRLQPFDALDAVVFVEINHLPHPWLADRFFTKFSWAMTGGAGWFLVLLGHLLWQRKAGWRAVLGVAPALWLATLTVEYPIKSYVRRQRPFLALIQAIVVGRKPGSYSFPSGHSAAAFAGAVLLSRHLPWGRRWFYAVAGLVAFSRVYLGAHYPGDVVVGSLVGGFLARVYARLLEKIGLPALPPGKKKALPREGFRR